MRRAQAAIALLVITGLAWLARGCIEIADGARAATDVRWDAHTNEDLVRATATLAATRRAELSARYTVVVVDDTFVVISDAEPAALEPAIETIQHVVTGLYLEFFDVRPDRPVEIALLATPASYEQFTREAYGAPPHTPYGFYVPDHRRIVVDLSKGTGTLAHELVHPLLAHDFPGAPPWFDEGLASLFEEVAFYADGTVRGRANWRLFGLRVLLAGPRPLPLRRLLAAPAADFYADQTGTHYAMARYLCMYLQEHGVLVEFYRRLRAADEHGDAGLAVLETTLEEPLETFEPRWQAWVLSLEPRELWAHE